MKVTFVYPDVEPHVIDWTGYFYAGLGSLSAVLKQECHETSLIHITKPVTKPEFIERINKENPDIIGFSSTSHGFKLVRSLASWLVEERVKRPTIYGGIHPTIAPEDSIMVDGIDMICRGEGEGPLVDLCRKIENSEDISDIHNLWIKKNGNIIENPLRPVAENLDGMPFPDRDIFDYQNLYTERQGVGSFMASRGCPFNCTYCCNHLLREIYGRDGKPVRFRSVDNFIAEIKSVVKKYPFIKSLVFEDDVLFLNRRWSAEFAEKYKREIAFPFACHARADATGETLIRLLKEAGCVHIKMGIESGNEDMRLRVLNRPMLNDDIRKTYALCKKAGMITQSYNIVGLPGDTPGTILDTIKLNAVIGVDIMYVTIFQPYHGTKLAELCREQKFIDSTDLGPNFFSPSILKMRTVSPSQIVMFRNYFMVLTRYYQLIGKLPFAISSIFIKLSDRIFSFELTSRVLNLFYLPLHYFFQRARLGRSGVNVRRSPQ